MKIWTTKSGIKIPYDQLKFSHIYNIIKYALRNGFFTIYTSHSIVDNSDDITEFRDCSTEVVQDMKSELKRRNITHAYYIEWTLNHDLRKVSPVFDSMKDAYDWAFRNNWPKKECRIIKEYLY